MRTEDKSLIIFLRGKRERRCDCSYKKLEKTKLFQFLKVHWTDVAADLLIFNLMIDYIDVLCSRLVWLSCWSSATGLGCSIKIIQVNMCKSKRELVANWLAWNPCSSYCVCFQFGHWLAKCIRLGPPFVILSLRKSTSDFTLLHIKSPRLAEAKVFTVACVWTDSRMLHAYPCPEEYLFIFLFAG